MFVGSVALFVASTAFAEGEACYVDKDCPGTACGDAVCNWTKFAATAVGMKQFYCNPAGSQTPVGSDGWCTTDADCKCMAEGAKCVGTYCSFTKAPGGGSAGASSGTAGAPSGTAGAPSGTAGAPAGTAGAPASTAGAPATGGSSDSGGCSLSLPGKTNSGAAAVLAALGLGFVLARRRR
jgi:hypothetical protein